MPTIMGDGVHTARQGATVLVPTGTQCRCADDAEGVVTDEVTTEDVVGVVIAVWHGDADELRVQVAWFFHGTEWCEVAVEDLIPIVGGRAQFRLR